MEKKYIKTFESFKNSENEEQVNEELFGLATKLFGFLKGIFKKAQDKIKKLPSFEDIKKYFETDLFNIKSAESIFSGVFQEYNKKQQFNDQDCFDFISKLIDPETSVISNNSIQEFVAGFDDEKLKKEIQYDIEVPRNKALSFFKYGGTIADSFVVGKALPVPAIKPELKSGKAIQRTADGKGFVEPNTHLPQLKKLIAGLTDDKKKVAVMNWVNNVLVKKLWEFSNAITEEEVDKFSGAGAEEVGVLGSYGVKEEKELVGKDIYYMMDGYDAKAPKKELVGKGKVTAFDETKGFSIETEKGTKFDKNVDKLLSKVEAEKLLGVKEGDVMDYARVKKLYDDKTEVYYLLPGVDKTSYDPKKKPEEQTEIVDRGLMISVDDQNNDKSIKFEKDGKTIERSYDDIVGFVGDQEKSEEAQEVAKKLGEIKDDPKKMKYVGDYTDFINKATEDDVNTINDMIKDELDKLPK